MRKQWLVLVMVLLAFWLIVSEGVDLQHIVVGLALALFTVWFWRDLIDRLPAWPHWQDLVLFGHIVLTVIRFVIQSNIAVAKTILLGSPPVGPVFVVMRPPIESNWGRVLLANCITITPGTVTIDVDPETGQFIVHSLTAEAAAGLFDWQVVQEISNLESWKQRRAKHGVAVSGSHGPDSGRALAGDLRPDGH
ncbi:MAG: Na+/H+ antiporter subunit E [Firmicutes bacterium]|nr:Na+/H+ antiporter subunit E [Bacillota bacterium]